MLGFSLNITIMLIAFFLIKSKTKIFLIWFITCFIPFFVFVRDGEERDLEMALSMGEHISMLKWYFGIAILSLPWTLMLFLVAFMIFCLLKLVIKIVKYFSR